MLEIPFTAHVAASAVCFARARAPFLALRIAISPILTKYHRPILCQAWRFRRWRQPPGVHVLTSDSLFNSTRPVTVLIN